MNGTDDKTRTREHYQSMADEARTPRAKPLLCWQVELTGDEIATVVLALGHEESSISQRVEDGKFDRDFWTVELGKIRDLRKKMNDLTTVVVR